jgi:hypothetical protein
MSPSSSERGRRLMIQPMVNKELELVVENVMNRLQELSHIILNIVKGMGLGQPRGDRLNLHDDFRNEACFESAFLA